MHKLMCDDDVPTTGKNKNNRTESNGEVNVVECVGLRYEAADRRHFARFKHSQMTATTAHLHKLLLCVQRFAVFLCRCDAIFVSFAAR